MSQYSHDLRKFADAGLQLRLPVDLVPANQFSRLTNAIPVIEGQLITRDGMTFIANLTQVAFVYQLERPNTTDAFASLFDTVYPNGYAVGDTVVITVIAADPSETSTIVAGSYTVTITSVNVSTGYGMGGYGLGGYGGTIQVGFTPGIAVTWSGTNQAILVFAQAVSTATLNTLTDTPIDNLFRLNQAITALPGDRVATMAGRVFHAPLPAGDSFFELVGQQAPGGHVPSVPVGFSGGPMAIVGFRFTKDSANWALFADGAQMYKYRSGTDETQIEYVPLGNAPPTVMASASAGGTGNLNSTGGTGYDWRYTYVDGLALTESNPSPISMTGGGATTTRPTTFTNPDASGHVAFSGPANAFDGSLTTAAQGKADASATGRGNSASQTCGCKWQGWLQPGGTVSAITLNVLTSMEVSADNDGFGIAQATATLSYSYDGGATFQILKSIHVTATSTGQDIATGLQTYSAVIPSSVSLTNVIVLAQGIVVAHGQTQGGDLFTSEGVATVAIFDINTTVVETGTVNALALVNKIARVCVTPSPYPQHTFINLYRRGGSLPDAWRFVSQSQVKALTQGACGAGTLEIDDNVGDAQLEDQPILELDNDQPVNSVVKTNQPLSFIWGPVGIDVRLLGCGDPARPESVYFSKPGNADAWPPENHVEVSDPGTPIIAGCVFNTRTFAFSRESIFELVEGLGTGATYTPFRTPSAHGLYAPFALAVGPAMFFMAKDGIYESMGGREVSIVENDIKPLFPTYDTPGQSVHGYDAVDMAQPSEIRLRYHNDELFFTYVGRDTGIRQVLIYDLLKKRWRPMQASAGISEVYSEPATTSSLLYGTDAGTIYQAGGVSDPAELDIIENMSITPVTVATSFGTTTYYVRALRYTNAGAVAISYEATVNVSATVGIRCTFPPAPVGTIQWLVWFGTTPCAENMATAFLESALPASRTVNITAVGIAGVMPTTNADTHIHVTVRTGAHDQGVPLNRKQYGNVIFDLDPGNAVVTAPITITPYINGEVQAEAALSVSGLPGRIQAPLDLSDFFAFNTEYEITWAAGPTGTFIGGVPVTVNVSPTLFQYDTLHFLEPVGVKHWQTQATSFEFPGFVHVRDCYIAWRSTASATLTMTIDGVIAQTYTLASTGGERLKQYVQFNSNKGLMYQFAVDSASEFRIYEPDVEFRVKPWLGVLGYSVQRIIGGEVNA